MVATTVAATPAEEFPDCVQPPSHHAQGFNTPFGIPLTPTNVNWVRTANYLKFILGNVIYLEVDSYSPSPPASSNGASLVVLVNLLVPEQGGK